MASSSDTCGRMSCSTTLQVHRSSAVFDTMTDAKAHLVAMSAFAWARDKELQRVTQTYRSLLPWQLVVP
jgi:hypothetical protein